MRRLWSFRRAPLRLIHSATERTAAPRFRARRASPLSSVTTTQLWADGPLGDPSDDRVVGRARTGVLEPDLPQELVGWGAGFCKAVEYDRDCDSLTACLIEDQAAHTISVSRASRELVQEVVAVDQDRHRYRRSSRARRRSFTSGPAPTSWRYIRLARWWSGSRARIRSSDFLWRSGFRRRRQNSASSSHASTQSGIDVNRLLEALENAVLPQRVAYLEAGQLDELCGPGLDGAGLLEQLNCEMDLSIPHELIRSFEICDDDG